MPTPWSIWGRRSGCTATPSAAWACSAAKAKARAGRQDGDGQQPTGKAGERFKVACGCQPPRSFWIRAKQYAPGPITCGVCGQKFQPQDAGRQ